MQIKARVFVDGKQVKPSEVQRLIIKSAAVDRIINDVAIRNLTKDSNEAIKAS